MSLTAASRVKLVCQVLDYPRSSCYGQGKGRERQALREPLEGVAATWPTYGYRRITAPLRR
jgi:putative transposase